jgi:hypothetical protein
MAAPNTGFSYSGNWGPSFLVAYTASYQINGGTAIAAGASVTDTVTFTGLATSDEFVIGVKAATSRLVASSGLSFVSAICTATNTVLITWTNTTGSSVTPPASATWYATVVAPTWVGQNTT